MIVWIVIAAVIAVVLVAAWRYDRLHPGALFKGSVMDLESDMARAGRDAARNDGFYDRDRDAAGYDGD